MMIVRIVQLNFKTDTISEFLDYFDQIKQHVNTFEGCLGMQLLQDHLYPETVFTYSHWESVEALEKYRVSKQFNEIWSKIKPLFGNKPHAWTTDLHFNGFSSR